MTTWTTALGKDHFQTTDGKFKAYAVIYDEPSESFGIDGGRVSKLTIIRSNTRGFRGSDSWAAPFALVNYDREWDIVPATDADRELLASFLAFAKNRGRGKAWSAK